MARTAVVAGTATATVGAVKHHQAGKQEQAEEQQAAAQQPPPATTQPAPTPAAPETSASDASAAAAGGITDETIDQLQKLASLKDQGILSEAEFTAAKTKILGV